MAMRALGLRPSVRHANALAARDRLVTARWQYPTSLGTRRFHVPTALAPPLIFTGLFVALWCWKCTMLVLFQNAIIYNPFLPPNARSMRISEFARHCGGIQWREERIRSLDGTGIALCVAEVPPRKSHLASTTHVYILYFQGQSLFVLPNLVKTCELISSQGMPRPSPRDCQIFHGCSADCKMQTIRSTTPWCV